MDVLDPAVSVDEPVSLLCTVRSSPLLTISVILSKYTNKLKKTS